MLRNHFVQTNFEKLPDDFATISIGPGRFLKRFLLTPMGFRSNHKDFEHMLKGLRPIPKRVFVIPNKSKTIPKSSKTK